MIQRSCRVRDARLETYESEGAGPPVFLLHGNSSSGASFEGTLASELGRRFRLIALSLPGHGGSEPARTPADDYAVPALAALVREVIAQYGVERYALVGHSLGGHVFSEALPGLPAAAGLVLVSAPPLSTSTLGAVFGPPPVDTLFKGELDAGEIDALAGALLGGARADEAAFARLRADIARTDPRFRPALGQSIMAGRVDDEVAAVAATRVPVALAWGTADAFLQTDYHQSVRLGAALGRGRYPFAGAGHSPHLERPREFQALLAGLLAEAFGAARGA